MPFALVIVGILMIVTGVQGTYAQFGNQVAQDFTGPGNFFYWIVAVGIIGAIGYAAPLQGISRLFMALVIIAMVLSDSKKGLFNSLTNALKSGPVQPLPVSGSATAADNSANAQNPGSAMIGSITSAATSAVKSWLGF